MRKFSNLELAQLYDNKDWNTLWAIITPMVKHAVRRCMQEGLDPFYVRDDLMQEAYMRAWESLPRWNAFEGSLQTWVRENVRIAVTDTNRRERSGMVGGRDSGPLVVSMHDDIAEDQAGDDEQELPQGHEARLTYDEPPEGFGDPSEAGDPERLLAQVPEDDRDMVRRLCGIGVAAQTQEEYACMEGIHRDTLTRRVRSLRKYFSAISRKTAIQVTRAA